MHARKLGDQTLTFIVSGKLWRNSLVMQDQETGSLWSHITGVALDGSLEGKQLTLVPSAHTTWAEWVKEHPRNAVLRKSEEIRASRYESYFEDPEKTGMFRAEWLRERLPGKSLVHGIMRGPHAVAITSGMLEPGLFLSVDVGGETMMAVNSGGGGIHAYVARAGGQDLHFDPVGDVNSVQDKETGSTWDLERGECVKGELAGSVLEEVVVRTAFWFAWSTFYPKTAVVD